MLPGFQSLRASARRLPLHREGWRRFVGACTALAIFALGLLAVSPGAHEHVHADAQDVDHACAITLAAGGFCDTSAALPAIGFSARTAEDFPAEPFLSRWTAPQYWHPPAQAPPVATA